MSNGVNKKYILSLAGIIILSIIFLIASKITQPSGPALDPHAEWETYISNELGIGMKYPPGFFYQEPATLTLDCQSITLPGNCPEVRNENLITQNEAAIGGKNYCVRIESDAATGSRYDKSNFNLQNEKGCFSLKLVVRSTNCGVYGAPEDPEYQNCEKENASKPATFEKILGTFKDTTAKKDFGFIRKIEIEDGKYFADFDNGVWLTGSAAKNAAIRASFCSEADQGDCLPSGYFIENLDRSTVNLEIDETPYIQLETFETGIPGDKKEIVSLEKFASLINDPNLNWRQLPYHLVVDDGKIVQIREQYVP